MRDVLLEHDVELRVGPDDMDDARDEIETARNLESGSGFGREDF